MYEKLKATIQEKDQASAERIDAMKAQIEEQVNRQIALLEIFTSLYVFHFDRVYYLLKHSKVYDFLPADVGKGIDARMERKRQHYKKVLAVLFKKHDESKLKHLEEMIEEQITRGHNLEKFYRTICDKFKETPDQPYKEDDADVENDDFAQYVNSLQLFNKQLGEIKEAHSRNTTIRVKKLIDITSHVFPEK
eukprot:UN24704